MKSLKILLIGLVMATGAGGAYAIIQGPAFLPPGQLAPATVITAGVDATDGPSALRPPSVSLAGPMAAPSPPVLSSSPVVLATNIEPVGTPPFPPPTVSAPLSGIEGTASQTGGQGDFTAFLAEMVRRLDAGDWIEALDRMSERYDRRDLADRDLAALLDLLDQVAGSVIYSPESIMEPPYRVRTGDTWLSIGEQYNVPGELLAKINCMPGTAVPVPGSQVKVLPGPFEAIVELGRLEMVLKIKGHYAGRFPLGLGCELGQVEGVYVVEQKVVNPACYGPDGTFAPDDPRNPLGERWLGLDGRLAIHGTDDDRNIGTTTARGAILLGKQDAEDVFDILSVGSKVSIRR